MAEKPGIIAVGGPTASGKSDLAIKLALEFGGEIVCCDSMQIYRGMDIGTAKPTREERALVPHHMVDFRDPREPYSVADYEADAVKCIKDILDRGRLPVVCGGTGLYLDSLLFEKPWNQSSGRTEVRDRLEARAAAAGGVHALWEELNAADPESAAAIHENNVRRVIRALEIYETTGRRKSELDRESGTPRYEALVLVLHRSDRAEQNARIEKRVGRMFAEGLVEETRRLLDGGVFACNSTAAQAIGYKEILGYLGGSMTESQAKENLVIATRRYAKRQDTWFLHRPYSRIIEIGNDSPDPYPEARELAAGFIGGGKIKG